MTTLRAWLALLRIPNVFTAFADPLAGFVLAAGVANARVAFAMAASGLLYLAGMAFNDWADREVDARERPGRPIPSGRVTPEAAVAVAAALMLAGVANAFAAARDAGFVAIVLAACVLLYDGVLVRGVKESAGGPVAMGSCRALSLWLGVVAGAGGLAPAVAAAAARPLLGVAPLALGAYTLLVTLLARGEVSGQPAAHARRVIGATATLLFLAAASLALFKAPAVTPIYLIFLGFLVSWLLPRWRAVWRAPTGAHIGRTIGASILMMPVLDAASVAAAGHVAAAAALCLLCLPAWVLKRSFYMT